MKPFKLNQIGMSLIEVMVSVAIMSVVAAGMASLISYSLSATKHVEQKSEQLEMIRSIDLALQDQYMCGLAMRNGLVTNNVTSAAFNSNLNNLAICNYAAGSVSCANIVDATGPGTNSFNTGIRITAMNVQAIAQLTDVPLIPPPYSAAPSPSPVAYRRYTAQLNISTNKAIASAGTDGFKDIRKQVILLVNPANNQVDLCESMESTAEESCRNVFGGQYDPNKNPKCVVNQVTVNSQGIWPQDVNNGGQYGMVAAQPSATSGTNLALAGPTPGIKFTPFSVSGSSATVLPAIDSGAASLFSNTTTGTITFKSAPNIANASVALSSDGGSVDMWTNSSLAVSIPNTGPIAMNRNISLGIYTLTAQAVTQTSDRRLKTDIQTHTNALDKILKLRGVTYHWKADSEKHRASGYIAQEIGKVIPESIHKGEDGILSVNYSTVISYITEAIKELVHKFEAKASEQDQRIADLEKDIEELRAEMRELKVRCEPREN